MVMSGFQALGSEGAASAKALRQDCSWHICGAEEASGDGAELAAGSGRRGNHRRNSRQIALGLKDFDFKSGKSEFTGRFWEKCNLIRGD